jgi:CheY-like chemotaxis protein
VRYTRQGKVLMGVRRRGTHLAIEVWDTGPGIAAEHQQRIFEEFSRLQSVRGDMGKGFGLGLAICMRMAKMLDHRIEVHSAPGRGSCFRLLAERTTARKPVEQSRVGRVSRGAERLRGVQALCIDDDAGVLAGMRALLETWGCEVQTADTPEAATAVLEQHIPQILLADYQLGQGRTGVEVVESVRAQLQSPVPAILITADVSAESAEAARRAKMRVLHKPVRPAALRALMSGLL